MKRTLAAVATALTMAVVVSACGSSDPLAPGPSGTAAPGDVIALGSANFPENALIAEIYAQALSAKGVKVTKKLNIGTRKVYLAALQDGSIDLIPEYSGNLLTELKPTATQTSPDDVYAELQKSLPPNLSVLEKSAAEDKDAFVVTQATAQKYNAKSIADIAPKCGELAFGGPPEFPQRSYGIGGLQKNYTCTFKQFLPLDVGGPLTVAALKDGKVQGANLFTTNPLIKANNFVVLEDPKSNFAAQNVLPLIRTSKASDTTKQVLNAISAKLTTTGLQDLYAKLAAPDKPNAEVVAKDWLTANGLL